MTNMVDAVLLKHAFLKKIDPKAPNAPRTMYEAVDKLVKPLHGGKLVNLDPDDPWLREFASKNLVIGITGAKNKKEGLPCYTFVDNGKASDRKTLNARFCRSARATNAAFRSFRASTTWGHQVC